MITNNQALALLKEYEGGNRRALNDIIILHQPLVGYYARKYFTSLKNHPIIEVDDLISAANIGLLKAVESFDEERGSVFKYFAGRAIKQAIMSFILTNMNTIKSPYNKMIADHKIHKLIEKLEAELMQEVTQEDIEESGLFKPDEIEHYYNKTSVTPMPEYFDIPDEETNYEQDEIQLAIKYINCLSEREQLIIKHYFAIDGCDKMTLEALGQQLGVDKQRIFQIRNKALAKVKEKLKK